MPGKQSKLRYKAMLVEVEDKAQEAFRSGVFANPYPIEDRRHARFNRRLNSIRITSSLFDF
jgi:hypothetical protein